jgi:uncharacterized MAPEG superfamily protein
VEALGFIAVEPLGLFLMGVLGVLQGLVRGEQGVVIRRNFAETFPLFVGLVSLLWAYERFGEFSRAGVLLYVFGRLAYPALSLRALRRIRRYAWALSVAGLVGLFVQVLTSFA